MRRLATKFFLLRASGQSHPCLGHSRSHCWKEILSVRLWILIRSFSLRGRRRNYLETNLRWARRSSLTHSITRLLVSWRTFLSFHTSTSKRWYRWPPPSSWSRTRQISKNGRANGLASCISCCQKMPTWIQSSCSLMPLQRRKISPRKALRSNLSFFHYMRSYSVRIFVVPRVARAIWDLTYLRLCFGYSQGLHSLWSCRRVSTTLIFQ